MVGGKCHIRLELFQIPEFEAGTKPQNPGISCGLCDMTHTRQCGHELPEEEFSCTKKLKLRIKVHKDMAVGQLILRDAEKPGKTYDGKY